MEIEIKRAIKRVIKKRKIRGATEEQIKKYLKHLKEIWKNEKEILDFLNRIKYKKI